MMTDIEIEHQCYCSENGLFCPFMDRAGYCYATSCKRMTDLLWQNEIDRQAKYEEEKQLAKLELLAYHEERSTT